ncbi:GNAT family N-acetyltransferase [Alcanivorax sp.]|uniref:GNAT family N-acetyltransferase n=1 Tax=Alcanivorax sp. TaxID=1872427 RepID=UPI0025B7B828|nr:GNAT family N-acetyltransferase [Alcanivorax sp.]
MLAQAAGKIKALSPQLKGALAKPFVATADILRFPRELRDLNEAEKQGRFSAYFTRSRREIIKVQRMRYRIFSEEYGASFSAPFGLDRDRYDRHCLHLIVKDNHSGEIVGYTRVLPGDRLHRTGGFYSSGEFDLRMLNGLEGRLAEIGRTCIHPAHRNGAVITVLWARLAQYMIENDIRYLLGCASIALGEGYNVAGIWQRITDKHMSAEGHRVIPHLKLEKLPGDSEGVMKMPPLLKAYVRMGAQICGEPCWDPDFNCLDFFVLMDVKDLPARYVQHFMQPVDSLAATHTAQAV